MKTTILLLLTQFLEKVNRKFYADSLLKKGDQQSDEAIKIMQWTLASAIKLWFIAIGGVEEETDEESIMSQPRMYTLDILQKLHQQGKNWYTTKFSIEQVAQIAECNPLPQGRRAKLVIPGELVDKHELLQAIMDAGKQ